MATCAAVLRDCKAIFVIAGHLAEEANLIPLFCSLDSQEAAAVTLEDILQSASPTSADLAELDGLGDFSYQQAFRRALQMENALGNQGFCDIGKVWIHCGSLCDPNFPLEEMSRWWIPAYNLFLRDEDLGVFRERMAEQRHIADQPCDQYRCEREKDAIKAYEAQEHRRRIAAPMMMLNISWHASFVTADAVRRLALTATAVCRFRTAQGAAARHACRAVAPIPRRRPARPLRRPAIADEEERR